MPCTSDALAECSCVRSATSSRHSASRSSSRRLPCARARPCGGTAGTRRNQLFRCLNTLNRPDSMRNAGLDRESLARPGGNATGSDILWQNDDGTPVIWFLSGTNLLFSGVAGSRTTRSRWFPPCGSPRQAVPAGIRRAATDLHISFVSERIGNRICQRISSGAVGKMPDWSQAGVDTQPITTSRGRSLGISCARIARTRKFCASTPNRRAGCQASSTS